MAERKPAARGVKEEKGSPANDEKAQVAAARGEDQGPASKAMRYSVQRHDDENGLVVVEVTAESGDEAAQKVLAASSYKGTSIRGVTPVSDPDAASLGGEREAVNMRRNAENPGAIVNTLGTEANAEATRELGKADVGELGE